MPDTELLKYDLFLFGRYFYETTPKTINVRRINPLSKEAEDLIIQAKINEQM